MIKYLFLAFVSLGLSGIASADSAEDEALEALRSSGAAVYCAGHWTYTNSFISLLPAKGFKSVTITAITTTGTGSFCVALKSN